MNHAKPTYTPGPWYATGVHVQSAILDEDNYVCEAEGNTVDQALANAKLIASVLDLLEALQMFVAQYEGNGRDDREQRPEMIAARIAIAKATGGNTQ